MMPKIGILLLHISSQKFINSLANLEISLDIINILNKGEIMNNRTITDLQPRRITKARINKAVEDVLTMIKLSRETKQPLSEIALAVSEKTINITANKIKN
jgi:hypothetical protein